MNIQKSEIIDNILNIWIRFKSTDDIVLINQKTFDIKIFNKNENTTESTNENINEYLKQDFIILNKNNIEDFINIIMNKLSECSENKEIKEKIIKLKSENKIKTHHKRVSTLTNFNDY